MVIQKFCNILEVYASLWCVYHVMEAVLAEKGSCCDW